MYNSKPKQASQPQKKFGDVFHRSPPKPSSAAAAMGKQKSGGSKFSELKGRK